MAYFKDFSEYTYFGPPAQQPGTKNIGWLADGVAFETEEPAEELLDWVWAYAKVSTVRSRGMHRCEFCADRHANYPERNGMKLMLGTAELRVFAESGEIYAAPNLIYHYIAVHHYKPPREFVEAMRKGPRPPDQLYVDKLVAHGLDWRETPAPEGDTRAFKLVKTPDGLVKVYVD